MQISVLYFTVLREVAGKKEEALRFSPSQKATITLALKILTDRYGKSFAEYLYEPTGQVKEFLQFFINGQSSSARDGLETELRDGDVLAIVPPVGGG